MQDSIKLVYYRVSNIYFKFHENNKPDAKFQILPKFECKMGKSNKILVMNLGIKVEGTEASPTPFDLTVNLIGHFSMDEYAPEDSKLQMRACLTQLMPFLRSTVASLTLNCNIPAYLMPFIDINSMVNSARPEAPTELN